MFFGDVILPTKYPEVKVLTYIIILAIPFIVTKFPFCAIDSTYYGIVEDIEVKMTKDARPASYSYKGYSLYDKGTVYLKIRTPDGELIRRKVYGGIVGLQQYINKFQKDDEVFHLYGTDAVMILPGEKDIPVQCPVCGELNERENGVCSECGHTLLCDLSFAWEGTALPCKKTAEEKFDLPAKVQDDYVERKERVYDDFVEGQKKNKRTEVKKPADTVEDKPYAQSTAVRSESYAEARKSAIIARKTREEQEKKLKKEEADFYADYDSEIINKAKETDEKKEKRSFFGEYFSYFGVAVLITHAISYIAMPLLGNTFLRAEANFFSQTLLFSVLLFWQFFVFGKNEFPHKRVGMKKMLLSGIPAFIVYAAAYAVYHGSGLLSSSAPLPGDGIHALALVLCGAGARSVTERPLRYDAVHGWIHPGTPFPQLFPLTLVISFLLNAVYYIFLAWIAYKFGIDERDVERRDIREGTDTVEMRRKRRTFAKCFIPFVNYYPIYSWSYDYWVNPEPDRKLKYFFGGVAAMLAGMTVIEILRYIFFQVCKSAFLNGVVFYLSLHLVGCVISLVAYFDDKRHEKLMERYKR
ncbi:MAG: hypothetical protein IJW21_00485 [Clostridia bacterium]|nr:hypothetical protein [Clostridia bacterium]